MTIFIMSYIDTTYQVVSSIVNLQLISYQEISKHYVLTTNHEFSMCRNLKNYKGHCVKSVRIRNYSGPHLSRIFPHSDWIRRDTLIKGSIEPYNTHCVKSVRIWSYSGPHFSRIFPHLDWIRRDASYSDQMRKNAGKMPTGITPNQDIFYAANVKDWTLNKQIRLKRNKFS